MERALPFDLDEFKRRQLFGIPLVVTDINGQQHEYTDDLIDKDIRAAVNTLERRLQIDIWPRRVITRPDVTAPTLVKGKDYDIADDPMDYDSVSFYASGYLRTRRYPLIKLEKLELRFPGNTSLFKYPDEWLRVNLKAGQINIVAITGASQPIIIAREGGYLPLLTGGLLKTSFPQLIYVDYVSGIDATNAANLDYYQDLELAIQREAAANVLSVVGRYRAGIASESLSEDGQSESTSYYRVQGGIYSGEIKELRDSVTEFVKDFRAAVKGPIFQVL